MDFNIYNKICTLAVNNNSNALKYIVDNIISPDQYYEICKLAITKDKAELQNVVSYIIREKQ